MRDSGKFLIILFAIFLIFLPFGVVRGENNIEEIISESLMIHDDDYHPLPLYSSWNAGVLTTSKPYTPDEQIKLIEQGHHIIPVFRLPCNTEVFPEGKYCSRVDRTEQIFLEYYENAIKKARDLNLPIVLMDTQFEHYLSDDPYYLNLPGEENPNIWLVNGSIQYGVSPFGPTEPWKAVGIRTTNRTKMKLLQEWYPDPPLVIFLSNNEHKKLYWNKAETDKRYLDLYGGGQSNEFKKKLFADKWAEKYRLLQEGIKDGLVSDSWKKNSVFIGYSEFGYTYYGRWPYWDTYALNYQGVIDPSPLTWDGGSCSYYTNKNIYGDTDYSSWSAQIEAMNLVFMKDEILKLNPYFYTELSIWDGGEEIRNYYRSIGQNYSSERYEGYVQFGMWLVRPRIMREYFYTGDGEHQFSNYTSRLIESVDRVYENEILKDFWRSGKLVANTLREHFYQSNIPEEFKNEERWFMLDADVNPPMPWKLSNTSVIPVYSIALVKDEYPNREWLVYSYSPLEERKNVVLRIPEYGEITVDVSVGGDFYLVGENSGRIENIFASDKKEKNENLIKNPGFEDGANESTGVPLQWSDSNFKKEIKKIVKEEKHSGQYSWMIDHSMINGWYWAYTDFIEVKPDTYYKLSCWAKSKTGEEKNFYLGWEEYDSSYNFLGDGGKQYFGASNKVVPNTWIHFEGVGKTRLPNTKYVRLRFVGTPDYNGVVWVDDFGLEEIEYVIPTLGCKNDENSKCLDLGGDELYSFTASAVSEKSIDSGITYRSIKPISTLSFSIPSFNVGEDGYPLSPMYLEIKYKDTIDVAKYSDNSHRSRHRAIIRPYLNYKIQDPDYNAGTSLNNYPIASLGDSDDKSWKYLKYAFPNSPMPLLRSVDGMFQIKIEMPNQGDDDASLELPIDYIALHKIDEDAYNNYYEFEKLRVLWQRVELPADEPKTQPIYGDVTVFSRDYMRPVYSNTRPEIYEIESEIKGFGTLGEIEPVTFSILSKNDLYNLDVSVTPLTNGIDTIDIMRIEKVVYDEKRITQYYDKNYARYYDTQPDRLEPFDKLDIKSGVSQRIWIKVFVPEEISQGTYHGKAIIKGSSFEKRINISFEVLPIKLDEPFGHHVAYSWAFSYVNTNNLSEGFRIYKETGLDPFMGLSSSSVKPVVKDGVITDYESSLFERQIERSIKEGILKRGALVDLSSMRTRIYKLLYANADEKSDNDLYYHLSSPEFVDAFSKLILKMENLSKKNGITFRYQATDEPGKDPYLRIITDRVFSIIKSAGASTTNTYYSGCDESVNVTPYYNSPNGGIIPPLSDFVDVKRWAQTSIKAGLGRENFGYYTTYTSYQRNPIYNRFSHGLYLFASDAVGTSVYAMNTIIGDPYNDFDQNYNYYGTFNYPDFIQAYPTKTGRMLDTMGLEGIREGIDDDRYVTTLRRLILENPDNPKSFEAQGYLDSIKSRIKKDYWEYAVDSDYSGYYKPILKDVSEISDSNDWEAFSKIRRRIFDYIKILTGSVEKTQNMITFLSPTPTASQRLSTGRFIIKAQINSPTLQSLQLLWNGKNYPILSQNAILKYNFDQNTQIGETSTTFKDLTTKSNNGVGINLEGDESVQGKYNKALQLDGLNDKIQIPHSPKQQVTSNGTWNYWVKLNSYDGCQSFISKRDTHNTNAAWSMGINFGYPGANKNLTFEYNIDSTKNWAYGYDKTSIPLNQWVMLTFVYNSQDSRNVRFYVNGKEIEPILEEAQNAPLYNSNSPIYIGAVNNGSACHFNGSIDELTIIGETLTQDEIQILYESSLVKQDSSTWIFTLNKGEDSPIPQGTYTYSLTTSDPLVGSESRMLFVGAETGGQGSQEPGEGTPPGKRGEGIIYDTKKGVCSPGETNPCGSSIGECKQGTQSCVSGQWGNCVGAIGPSEEVCDGLDNNCNGQIDENCLCVEGQKKPCGSNIGICEQGVQSCVGGKWGSCVGNTPPLTEDICFNYLDDNCNGEVDEGCGEAFNTCNNGKLDEGEQGIDCGGKCPKKCPDIEMISVLMILVGLFGMIGTTVYFGYIK